MGASVRVNPDHSRRHLVPVVPGLTMPQLPPLLDIVLTIALIVAVDPVMRFILWFRKRRKPPPAKNEPNSTKRK